MVLAGAVEHMSFPGQGVYNSTAKTIIQKIKTIIINNGISLRLFIFSLLIIAVLNAVFVFVLVVYKEKSTQSNPVTVSKKVSKSNVLLDRQEVSVSLYSKCVRERRCSKPQDTLGQITAEQQSVFRPFCNYGQKGKEEHPINCVTYGMAEEFCAWAGKRLPTEEEWEFAARGSENRRYPWGGQFPDGKRMNGCGLECADTLKSSKLFDFQSLEPLYQDRDGFLGTAPVDAFPNGQTPQGLLNMAGNVAEWTSTKKEAGIYITRGGHWLIGGNNQTPISTTGRESRPENAAISTIGFRCASDLE